MVNIKVSAKTFAGRAWVAQVINKPNDPTDPLLSAEGTTAAEATYNLLNKYPKETGVTIEEVVS